MRVLVDLRSHLEVPPAPQIIQVQKTPAEGSAGASPVNGRYLIPMPLDVDFPVSQASYILDGAGEIDGEDVVSQGYAHLLAAYPQYGNIYFNPLITADHVGELVVDQSVAFIDRTVDPPVSFYSRFLTGRESGVDDAGQMPTHTALCPLNRTVTPERPGIMITNEIDIGPYTLDCDGIPVGTDQFMVYWKLYDFEESHDIASDWGANAGENSPAIRQVKETNQEPADFSVYISIDNGANWCQVGLLEPIAFCDKTTKVRLAFRNDDARGRKVYIASYALLF